MVAGLGLGVRAPGAPASMRLPKKFQPVGTSKKGRPFAAATRSSAPLVGMLRATPCAPRAARWALPPALASPSLRSRT